MEKKDFNLEVVTRKENWVALRPINECIINGRKYSANPNEKDLEKIYIPIRELEFGCIMTIETSKKSWYIKMREFFWRKYIEIWEVPYKENGDYTEAEMDNIIITIIHRQRAKALFPMK